MPEYTLIVSVLVVLLFLYVLYTEFKRFKLSWEVYTNSLEEDDEDAYDPNTVNHNNQYDYIHDYMTAPSPQPMYTTTITTTIPRKRHISRPIRMRKRYRGKLKG